MKIKTAKEIKLMQKSGKILSDILNQLKKHSITGVKTIQLEKLSQRLLDKYHVKGAFKGYQGYPYNTCISVNDELVHNFPSERVLNNGDIVSIDFGVIYNGYYSDSAITFGVGKLSNQAKKLIKYTKKSLDVAIDHIKPGIKMGSIQNIIENIIVNNNLVLVKELTGHGIGTNLQEPPQIPNYGAKNTGITLKEGMTFCLEPMTTLGNGKIVIKDDGWGIASADETLSAHFEHTVAVTKKGYTILTK